LLFQNFDAFILLIKTDHLLVQYMLLVIQSVKAAPKFTFLYKTNSLNAYCNIYSRLWAVTVRLAASQWPFSSKWLSKQKLSVMHATTELLGAVFSEQSEKWLHHATIGL
jgi:hypothetical protein